MTKKRKKRKQQSSKEGLSKALLFELYGIVIFSLSLITMAQLGAVGRSLTYLSRFLVGNWDFLLPLGGLTLAVYIMVKRHWPDHWSPRWTGVMLIVAAFLIYIHIETFDTLKLQGREGPVITTTWKMLMAEQTSRLPTDIGGGMMGALGFALFQYLFDQTGSRIAVFVLSLVGIMLVTGYSYVNLLQSLRQLWRSWFRRWKVYVLQSLARMKKSATSSTIHEGEKKQRGTQTMETSDIPVIHDFSEKQQEVQTEETEQPELFPPQKEERKRKTEPEPIQEEKASQGIVVQFETEKELPEYKLPPFSLLDKPKKRGHTRERQGMTDNAKKLENTLDSFGVKAKVTQIHRGPAVTRYEVQPSTGVKVSRIVNLSDDIALALAAKDIRIEAPIPGKSAVGIEVPNPEVSIVRLRDVLESPQYHESDSKLSIGLGRDISGEPIVGDLSKMPHLLVAGATGAGKSVCINDIICSMLYKAKPSEVKFMMIDPKMVELNIYNGIPHLLTPVVTDSRRAAIALKKVVAEMEKRYELFAKSGARDIQRYNQILKQQEKEKGVLPYIVVIVDELADLMMVAPGEVEDAICRLAQMARAAGIHLIIATQRPSVDVITGVIKANIPSRIAFGVSSQADSRTILDMGGAEKLLGRGDMLYLPVGASKPIRIQGSFLSDREVESVVRFVKNQQEVRYHDDMIPEEVQEESREKVEDELFPQAVELVVEAKTASVSLLQRRLRIGYTRAARLIDYMEQRGIVGPYEGSKPREVLMAPEQLSKQHNISL
ncbi:DNA translocase FtsK [Kroppenstedtia pulmonis]|uniref:DNA translocase FtsK n=1 Tax=Kroppenstedtia pulmonis TaxID=1380685 RepID=A0A7D3Y9V7_9BACL|nr:DNA translocase FtsK [Kroppenstedtia pulmonis]QKG84541.1 DNA translocase FtsK [Kroppenstedtia pulmonis]